MAVPQMAMQNAVVESAPIGRARPALGLDFVRIPIPVLRLFAVPVREEVTVRVPQAQYVSAPMMMQAAPMMAVQQVQPQYTQVPVQAAQIQFAQPVAQVPVQMAPQTVPMAVCPPCPPCPTNQAASQQAQEIQSLSQQVQALEALLDQYSKQK
jgi:hypothetical protein